MGDDHDCGGFFDRLRLAWLVFRLRGRRYCAAESVLHCLDSYDDPEIHGHAHRVEVWIGDVDGEDVTGAGGGTPFNGNSGEVWGAP